MVTGYSNARATPFAPFRRAAAVSTRCPDARVLDSARRAGICGRDFTRRKPMDPVEICRRLGEAKTKAIFLELTSEGMKKVLREAKIPTTRMASHTTTRKRNDDWAGKLWRVVADRAQVPVAATLL